MSDFDTLSKMISRGANLTEPQKQSLFELVGKRAHQSTKERLHEMIFSVPLEKWGNYSIYSGIRVQGNSVSYHALQDFTAEITFIRNRIIGKV